MRLGSFGRCDDAPVRGSKGSKGGMKVGPGGGSKVRGLRFRGLGV